MRPFVACWLPYTLLVVAFCLGTTKAQRTERRRVCSGTENGLNKLDVQERKIARLRLMYANCTVVHGNLEITYLADEDLENSNSLDFFSSIEEVTGYVLIAHNSIRNFSLPNLRIIWGDKQFQPASDQNISQFGLLVLSNGLDNLDLSSLRAVQGGAIGVQLNPRLCHWQTLSYRQLLGDTVGSRLFVGENHEDCLAQKFDCHPSCSRCWGPTMENCQKVYRDDCAAQCSSGMCYGKANPQYCCHPECAAGCFGPSDQECYGCKTMRNDGKCVEKCPAPEIYDPIKTQYVANPNGKYAFNRECVTQCPGHMVIYKDGCVSRCPEDYYAPEGSNVCKPCHGICPKTCVIEQHVSTLNIKDFVGCTKVDGFIEIRKDTFDGGATFLPNRTFARYGAMSVDELEALSSVRQVTQYVLVQSELVTSMDFLRNLEKIEGRQLFETTYALYITHSVNLQHLGTTSLKAILNGNVYISKNYNLCYIHNIPWDSQILSKDHNGKVRGNRESAICEIEGKVCDPSCNGTQGCWGPGSDMCFSCEHWRLANNCVNQCSSTNGLYQAGPKQCDLCHAECISCVGPGPRNCTKCRHVSMDDECVPACPFATHFENRSTRVCERCHENCYTYGCTGPGNFVGRGGCNRCSYGVVSNESAEIVQCLRQLSAERPCSSYPGLDNYFWAVPMSQKVQSLVANAVCMRCHPACKRCVGFGTDTAHYGCECLNYAFKESENTTSCVLQCPKNTFTVAPSTQGQPPTCIPCDAHCDGCDGPDSTDCLECVSYKDYLVDQDKFNCTSICPAERPFVSSDRLCTDVDIEAALHKKHRNTQIAVGITVAILCLVCILAIVYLVLRQKASLMAQFKGPNPDLEIVAEAAPNLSRLLLIRDSELKRGGALGYGAFGTVYKGIWLPDDRKVKVPVAIKVLHEASPAAQQDTLEEARLMASMHHPHLVQLIGVCVGQQMMLITPLMPLGNLLDYVKSNKSKIGSAALICWFTQIADGMNFLEQHRLVHRDLAARNVLVQKPYHVRITDFGLAKLLEYGESEVKIFEGKMPIKWLALECIKYRKYTHKSDVWAFGITLWELLTFGDKPYKEFPLQQIPQLLENGERLCQPDIATLDMYMIMIRCWMVDADARPSFAELRDIFVKMAKDPGRYLVIEGDALLRLPVYTPQDQQEMIRQLMDDPDVIDPEDYFSVAPTSSPPVSPTALTKPLIENAEPHAGCSSHRHTSSVSQRYASDPVKTGHMVGPFTDMPKMIADTDNYLIPDSQRMSVDSESGVFVGYTDGKGRADSGSNNGNNATAYYNDLRSPDLGICLENLEYMQQGVGGDQRYHNLLQDSGGGQSGDDVVQTETVV